MIVVSVHAMVLIQVALTLPKVMVIATRTLIVLVR
jgi:hypothetical protein